jgi:spermidine/putrescine transport system permease protein
MNGSLVKSSPCGPFHWYCDLAKNDDVLEAAGNTLKIAITATIISTIIGTMAALALQRYDFKLKPFSQVSLYIPIVIPEIVMGIGALTLFSQLFHFLNSTLNLSGDARLSLGIVTVTVSHIAFMIPFVTPWLCRLACKVSINRLKRQPWIWARTSGSRSGGSPSR